jgi:hypothetical protein
MPQLTISPEDAAILREVLDSACRDLQREIWHTDSRDYRAVLRAREAAIERLLSAVSSPVPRDG